MKKTFFISILLCLFFLSLVSASSFESFKKSHEADFSGYNKDIEKEFTEYKKEIRAAFVKYKKKASKIWGDEKVDLPGKKKYVAYERDFRKKTIIDFEKGAVGIEFVVSPGDEKKIDIMLKKEISQSLELKGDNRSIVEIAEKPDSPVFNKDDKGLLNGLVDYGGVSNLEYAGKILAQKNYKTRKIKGSDGKERLIVSFEFDLVSNHMEKRAKKYVGTVLSHSKKRNVDPELILAIIETESAFNPYAKSPIPAFGLMQLVPATAGRDSYRLVYRKDKAPTDKYLYKAKNNIELGTAYFYLLLNRYLDEIINPESRKWCAVAAYNTGIGNIFKTFTGPYSSKVYGSRQAWKLAAFAKINKMTPHEVYNHLCKKLPYKETRNYVGKVKKRISNYKVSQK